MKKIVLYILFFVLTAYANETKMQKVTLQLLWKHQFEFAGFYVAKEKGYYKNLGIDVEFKEYEFGTNIAKEVALGNVEFGLESSSLILDKINGLDVYLMMPVLQTSPFILLTKKRDDLKDVKDLAGKRVMVTPNQVGMASLNAMFKVNSLSNKDFIAQEHSFNTQDLIDDKTDALSSYISNEPFYLKEKNIPYNIFNPADYGFNFYDNILFTSKSLENKDPKLVKDFYEASKKGWDYAFSNIEETAKLIKEKYNTQNKSLVHLIFEGKELKKLSGIGTNSYGKFKPEVISQIVQTYNLLDISNSTVDFEKLVYPDAIYVEESIDYDLVWKVLIGLALVFAGLFYWNRKLTSLNEEIKKSKNKVSILLNNAGQGFLTFSRDFLVDKEYSIECEKLLGEDIEAKDISKLLFEDEEKQKIFKDALLNAMNETIQIKRNSYLSLLPSIIVHKKRALKLEYKIIDKSFMMIITNITSEKKLENKIKKEQQTFKMIVTIVSESDVFYDTRREYFEFIENYSKYIENDKEPLFNINNIYRVIHTFKGTFSQLYMKDIVDFLHKLEGDISAMVKDNSRSNEELLKLLDKRDFKKSYEETMSVIDEVLGDEFLESENYLKVDIQNINDLQDKIAKIFLKHSDTTPECQEVLCQIQSLSSLKLITMLKPYTSYTYQLAIRLDKEIYDFDILGDTEIVVSTQIKSFTKSLVHIFRNCVDHGIEDMDQRVENGKDEIGSVSCTINEVDDMIHITIADDGQGIDIEAIKQKANDLEIDTSNMNENEILELIFSDNFTTKEEVSNISGRGVGLASVKHECEKLGGKINISSKIGVGTTFEFIVPKGL